MSKTDPSRLPNHQLSARRNFPNMLSFVIGLVLVISSSSSQSASWGAVEDTDGHNGTFLFGWPNETINKRITCYTQQCIIGVGPWDPRGSVPHGGINNPRGLRTKLLVPSGTPLKKIRQLWVAQHGAEGSYRQAMWGSNIDLSTTCFGFQSFPDRDTTIGTLLPGTTCGKVPPANVQCSVKGAGLLSFGVIAVGSMGGETSSRGRIRCNKPVTVSAFYGRGQGIPSIGGVPVSIRVNGEEITAKRTIIGQADVIDLDVRASLTLPARTPGKFREAVSITLEYE